MHDLPSFWKSLGLLQVTEPYDWRLALPNLEKRDALFTRMKSRIEILVKSHGEKVRWLS